MFRSILVSNLGCVVADAVADAVGDVVAAAVAAVVAAEITFANILLLEPETVCV